MCQLFVNNPVYTPCLYPLLEIQRINCQCPLVVMRVVDLTYPLLEIVVVCQKLALLEHSAIHLSIVAAEKYANLSLIRVFSATA